MEAEELILKVQEYINSPSFIAMKEKDKKRFIKHGVTMIMTVWMVTKAVEYLTNTLELDELKRDLELAKLEKLWLQSERKE